MIVEKQQRKFICTNCGENVIQQTRYAVAEDEKPDEKFTTAWNPRWCETCTKK